MRNFTKLLIFLFTIFLTEKIEAQTVITSQKNTGTWYPIMLGEKWDYDNDGVKELVVIRDNATSWEDKGQYPQGFYVQILQVNNKELLDITESTIENFTEVNNTNLKPIRFIDFDGDGYLSMIRLVTNVEFYQSFEWEWDGSKIIKVSP